MLAATAAPRVVSTAVLFSMFAGEARPAASAKRMPQGQTV